MKPKLLFALIFSAFLANCLKVHNCSSNSSGSIKVGILHSATGTMSTVENPVALATLHAIKEINSKGGLLGQTIVPIVKDGKSNDKAFIEAAEELITKDKVQAIFGCWTSSSRKAVKEVVEKHGSLLMYPLQYEGAEESPNIFYIGMTANQQILPGTKYMLQQAGPKIYVVGSDYIFPRISFEIIKDAVAAHGGQVIGSKFLPLGSSDVEDAAQEIKNLKPNAILNLINGNTNLAFFRRLRELGISPDLIPTMSFSLTEEEISILGHENMIGDYATWSYFQAIDSAQNKNFLADIKAEIGKKYRIFDPMESAYSAVNLWAQAVQKAKAFEPQKVIMALKGSSFPAPSGPIYIDPGNNHSYRVIRIAKLSSQGEFRIIWSSNYPIKPVPFIATQSKEKWEQLIQNLYIGWGKNWGLSI